VRDLLPLPKLVKYYETTKRSFCFQFKAGWAHFTVDDKTGEFSVQSDWGDYAYRWHVGAIGESSMYEFLANVDAHYIVDKLGYGEPREFRKEYQEDATRKALQREVCSQRRRDCISKEDARVVYDELDSMDCAAEAIYYEMPRYVSDLFKYTDIYEFFVYEPSTRYRILVEQLIPLFQAKLRELGYGRKKKAAT
jgi:hypothetical protein